MSRFEDGDRVWHRTLQMFGTYQEKHNWGEPETSSNVVFDGDDVWPDGRPVTTDLLVPQAEARR